MVHSPKVTIVADGKRQTSGGFTRGELFFSELGVHR
jgi:hypothetical protein